MAVPLPASIPGEFFVLRFDEDSEVFIIHLDDKEGSSYQIGSVAEAMLQMKLWGVNYHFASRALDYAKEFKAPVQCIESEDRTISLRDKTDTRSLVWEDHEKQVGWLHSV